ncbi:hypothetical protein Tco_0236403 [Tanacetum coccineum]
MTSFDCRLKAIKACSACGNLHTSAFCCSKEKLKNKILVPMPESSQQHIKIERICFDCGNLLHGLNCLECDLTRKILEKAFQKFQNTSKSSNDNSNGDNAPRGANSCQQDPMACSLSNDCTCKSELWERSIEDFSDLTVDSTFDAMKIPSLVSMSSMLSITSNSEVTLLKGNGALKDNPVPSSVVVTKSTSTFPNLFLEETNTFDNSFPESETFSFNLEEISSGSPTTHSELSLPDYKAFYIDNDHFKEKSSGSTTTHVDFSQYDSFIFDLSNDQFPPADRSDFYHEEFADGLAHIISPPEYDRFCFKIEPELGNLTMDVVGNIFQTREPRVHVLNVLPTLELDFIPSSESIFAYVVWIFLPFLFIPVIPPYLLSCGDEDTIFDPGISKDCPDCEDSQFCHSSRVSHPQLHLGIRYPNLID